MPTYEYACENCGHQFERFQPITASPLRRCPACGKRRLRRLIGVGGGVIFKGSGFYETDYRSEAYKKAAEAEKSRQDDSKGKAKEGQSDGQASAKSGTDGKKGTSSSGNGEASTAESSNPRKAG